MAVCLVFCVSCSNKSDNKPKYEGSEEYVKAMTLMDECEAALNNAKTLEELDEVWEDAGEKWDEVDGAKMSFEEADKADEKWEMFSKLHDEKKAKLGADDSSQDMSQGYDDGEEADVSDLDMEFGDDYAD